MDTIDNSMDSGKLLEIYRTKVSGLINENINLRRNLEEVLASDDGKYRTIQGLQDQIKEYQDELHELRLVYASTG